MVMYYFTKAWNRLYLIKSSSIRVNSHEARICRHTLNAPAMQQSCPPTFGSGTALSLIHSGRLAFSAQMNEESAKAAP